MGTHNGVPEGRLADRLTMSHAEQQGPLTRTEKMITWGLIAGFFLLVAICCASGIVVGMMVDG